MLIRVPSHSIDVHLAKMVIPRSFSRSFESMTRSSTCWFSRKLPLCAKIESIKVVLPWSTWAIMAILRISLGSLVMVISFWVFNFRRFYSFLGKIARKKAGLLIMSAVVRLRA